MTPDAGSLSLAAALVAGLAASGHCLGMCGGIAGALAMRRSSTARNTRPKATPTIGMPLGPRTSMAAPLIPGPITLPKAHRNMKLVVAPTSWALLKRRPMAVSATV